jgi:hypothetical protein
MNKGDARQTLLLTATPSRAYESIGVSNNNNNGKKERSRRTKLVVVAAARQIIFCEGKTVGACSLKSQSCPFKKHTIISCH